MGEKQIEHKCKVHLGQDGHLFIHLPKHLSERWELAPGDEVRWVIEHVAVYLEKVR